MTIRHLLLDADGVVQRVGGDGWRAEIERRLGDRADDFVTAVDALEEPALCGDGEFPEGLVEVLDDAGLDLDAEDLYAALWETITVSQDTLDLVAAARVAGLGIHLATNQHRRRAALMQQLEYAALFDTGFYSCELGVAKPDPAFFETVLARLGPILPDQVVFVDDSRRNVDAAAYVGLRAVHWHLDEGATCLRERLAGAGLALPA